MLEDVCGSRGIVVSCVGCVVHSRKWASESGSGRVKLEEGYGEDL